MSMDTYGIIGFTTDNVGIDRRFYTGRTDTDPTLAVSYNERRVDVYLNGIKLVGDHPGNSDHDYDIDAQTGQGSSITLKTGVALVASDVIECIGYVSLSGNTVTSHNPTPTSGDGGYNEFRNIGQASSDLLNVYLNGVLLDDSDYTSDPTANGGTVTIGSPAITASDIVVIQVIGTLNNNNFVPAGGGTFSGNVSFGDNNITNVGDIAVDTISSDAGTSIGVNLGTDAGDDFNVGSGKLVVEGDTGNVGIGTSDPDGLLQVESSGQTDVYITAGNTSEANLLFGDSTLVTDAGIRYNNNGQYMRFITNNAEGMRIKSGGDVEIKTGNVVIGQAGKGINFTANTDDEIGAGNVGGETLDDYEYGTWTPQLTEGSYNYTMHSDNDGRYVKIGNMVHISALVRPNDNVHSNGNYNAQSKISGLPFTSGSNGRDRGGFSFGKFNLADSSIEGVIAHIDSSTTTIELSRTSGSSTSPGILTISNFNGNGASNAYYIYLSGTYYTD